MIEKTRSEIRIRIKNPKLFKRFRYKNFGKGIKAVIGFRDSGSEVQSYRFDKKLWTIPRAKAWVKKHRIN